VFAHLSKDSGDKKAVLDWLCSAKRRNDHSNVKIRVPENRFFRLLMKLMYDFCRGGTLGRQTVLYLFWRFLLLPLIIINKHQLLKISFSHLTNLPFEPNYLYMYNYYLHIAQLLHLICPWIHLIWPMFS